MVVFGNPIRATQLNVASQSLALASLSSRGGFPDQADLLITHPSADIQ
jgi:hypothetical protein